MGSYNRDTKLKPPTIEELFSKTPSSKNFTPSNMNTPSTTQKQKITPTTRINSPNTQLCEGFSIITGKPCKRSVVSDSYCYQHKDQVTGKNIFGIPTTPKKNDLSKKENYSEEDIQDVIDLSNDSTKISPSHSRKEKLSEIENRLNSLSLNNSKKDQLDQDCSKIKNNETGSTSITINLSNLKVQITEEPLKRSTQVSISSEDNRSNFDNREHTPPPIIDKAVQTDNKLPPQDRLPIESPACIDDSFIETTNKELFQTPNLVTPSNELILAPLLSTSPSKSPLDCLHEILNLNPEQKIPPKSPCQSPKTMCTPDRKPPSTPTPTRTRMLSSYTYESHVSISATPSPRSHDLTGDNYSPSKNGKVYNRHHKKFIEPVEEELEKAVFVPGRARLTWLRFGEWIKSDLSPDTRRLLRSEMEKPISDKDEPGFIYAYRLLEGPNSKKNSQYTLYKIGRATNVHRRLYQWSKQCGYVPQLICIFPNIDKFSSISSQEILLTDKEEAFLNISESEKIPKCKYTHRAERLVHIELGARFKADIEKCNNCGNLHREWFKVTADSDNNVMHGWEEVKKVILHWLLYVEKVYGVG